MSKIYQTFYVSSATTEFDSAAVQAILHVSRRNNFRSDVTGCLLFSGRYFAQVLEGDRSSVLAVRQRICADPRHRDVRVLVERQADEREYGDWSMGFLHDLNLEDDLETLLIAAPTSGVIASEVMERMRPDPVMGALR